MNPVVNRLIDVVEIYKASRALKRIVDEALVATAQGLETAAQLAVDFPSPRSQRVAEATVADLLGRVREFVGEDNEAAVQEIGDLAYTALIFQRRGDLQTARELVVQMQREGKLSSSIHPLSALTKPVDWLTAVARCARDTPEQAAHIMISGTKLRELSPATSAEWVNRDAPDLIILPGESVAGFVLEANGVTHYGNQILFEAWPAGNGSDFRLHVFRAPVSKAAVVLYFHPDFGAMRIALVDMAGIRLLNNDAKPLSRWGPSHLAFSPNGAYGALAFPTGEFNSALGIFETATGRFFLHQPISPDPQVFITPELTSLELQDNGILRLRHTRWEHASIGHPRELDSELIQISLLASFSKSADPRDKSSHSRVMETNSVDDLDEPFVRNDVPSEEETAEPRKRVQAFGPARKFSLDSRSIGQTRSLGRQGVDAAEEPLRPPEVVSGAPPERLFEARRPTEVDDERELPRQLTHDTAVTLLRQHISGEVAVRQEGFLEEISVADFNLEHFRFLLQGVIFSPSSSIPDEYLARIDELSEFRKQSHEENLKTLSFFQDLGHSRFVTKLVSARGYPGEPEKILDLWVGALDLDLGVLPIEVEQVLGVCENGLIAEAQFLLRQPDANRFIRGLGAGQALRYHWVRANAESLGVHFALKLRLVESGNAVEGWRSLRDLERPWTAFFRKFDDGWRLWEIK